MKHIFIITIMLSSFTLKAEDDEYTCNDQDNYFITSNREAKKNCVDYSKGNQLINSMKEIELMMKNESLKSCTEKLTFDSINNEDALEKCHQVTSCVDQFVSSTNGNDNLFSCSLNYLSDIFTNARFKSILDTSVSSIYDSENSDLALYNSFSVIKGAFSNEFNDDFRCDKVEFEPNCFDDIPGLNANMVSKTMDSKTLEELSRMDNDGKTPDEFTVNLFKTQFASDANVQTVGRGMESISPCAEPDNLTNCRSKQRVLGVSQAAFQIDTGFINGLLDRSNTKILEQLESIDSNLIIQINLSKKEELANIFKAKKEKFLASLKKDKNGKIIENLVNRKKEIASFYTSFAKELKTNLCQSSLNNKDYLCKKIVEEFKKPSPDNLNAKEGLLTFIKKSEDASAQNEIAKFKKTSILSADKDLSFNFEKYLKLADHNRFCVLNFQAKAYEGSVNGKNAEERYKNYISRTKKVFKKMEAQIQNQSLASSKKLSEALENSGNVELQNLGRSYRASIPRSSEQSSERSERDIAASSSAQDKAIKPSDANSIAQSTFQEGSNYGTKGVTGNTGNSGKNNSSQLNNPYSTYSEPNVVESSQSLVAKKIDELAQREKELSKKVSDKSITSTESDEMAALKKQIEDLKAQLASGSDKKDALGNKIITANGASAQQAGGTSLSPQVSNKGSFSTSSRDKRTGSDSSESYSSKPNFDEVSMGGADRSSASKAVSSSAGRSPTDSKGIKGYGLVLTSNGEVAEDLSKIAENPKESDILRLYEKSNGKPFLIKENGSLVQVQIELDAKGKPIFENGKPKLKKTKLSKEAEKIIAKEINVIREAKAVRDTTRLQDLRKVTNEAVK